MGRCLLELPAKNKFYVAFSDIPIKTSEFRNTFGQRKTSRKDFHVPYFLLPRNSGSVKCRFSKCRFSVLNLKFDFISDGGCTRERQIQKALGSLPPCGNRCRFSESAICSSRVRPPSEIKSNFKFKTLRWRLLRWRLTLSEKQLPLSKWRPNPQTVLFFFAPETALLAKLDIYHVERILVPKHYKIQHLGVFWPVSLEVLLLPKSETARRRI